MSSNIERVLQTIENWNERIVQAIEGTVSQVQASLTTAIAGERNSSSATASYLSVKDEWNYTVVDCSVNSTTVSAVPTILGNIWLQTALSAHTVVIADDATPIYTFPASTAATTTDATAFTFLRGTRFETSLVVNPDDSSTGTIVVQWRPI